EIQKIAPNVQVVGLDNDGRPIYGGLTYLQTLQITNMQQEPLSFSDTGARWQTNSFNPETGGMEIHYGTRPYTFSEALTSFGTGMASIYGPGIGLANMAAGSAAGTLGNGFSGVTAASSPNLGTAGSSFLPPASSALAPGGESLGSLAGNMAAGQAVQTGGESLLAPSGPSLLAPAATGSPLGITPISAMPGITPSLSMLPAAGIMGAASPALAAGGTMSGLSGYALPALGLINAGASIYGANKQSDAIEDASAASAAASASALELQKYMYEKGIDLNKPFYDPVVGGKVPDLLTSAVTGQPSNGVSYDYRESPVAKYALEYGGRDLMRGLGARGLAGSGLAPYKMGQLSSEIYANDYDKQIGRLSGLVDMARGTSNTMTNLGQNYATQGANININAGDNLGNAAMASGRNQASLYSGLGQGATNLASLYLMGGGKF
ncbi:MAG: hypothetical protein NUV80_03745, partial [Candidatus Berkelbacteria bacterium]|nr:hypothetical protein [Candidatus Berkelbacteria bacterium]